MLAIESMFVAAHSLGLGARIYGSPTGNINSNKDLFQIPTGYKAVVVLRIGNTDKTVDAVSAASPRKKFEEVVNYKKSNQSFAYIIIMNILIILSLPLIVQFQ